MAEFAYNSGGQRDDAVLFYTQSFYMGTLFMNDAQVGKYIRALCNQRNIGHLTQDQIDAIVAGDPAVMAKFEQDAEGNWFNRRMEAEIEKREAFIMSRKYARSHGKTNKIDGVTYVLRKENPNIKDNSILDRYFLTAKRIRDKILYQNSEARITDYQVAKWVKDIRLMIEKDARTIEQIETKIEEVFNDEFWKSVIRSAGKLRQRWNEGKLDRLGENRYRFRTGSSSGGKHANTGRAIERERDRGHYDESGATELRLL